MPDGFLPDWNNPLVRLTVGACAALIVFALLLRFWRARADARLVARRRAQARARQGFLNLQQEEIQRLAQRIIATSTQSHIAGFELLRQVEALFTDGHTTAAQAVNILKAIAAEKGANALINLDSARQANSRFSARGDAVLVRPVDAPAPPDAPKPK